MGQSLQSPTTVFPVESVVDPSAHVEQAAPPELYLPMGQSLQSPTTVFPVEEVVLPSAHVEQVVAAEVCPATYFPTSQIVHPDPGVDVASPEYPAAQRLHAFADAIFV